MKMIVLGIEQKLFLQKMLPLIKSGKLIVPKDTDTRINQAILLKKYNTTSRDMFNRMGRLYQEYLDGTEDVIWKCDGKYFDTFNEADMYQTKEVGMIGEFRPIKKIRKNRFT